MRRNIPLAMLGLFALGACAASYESRLRKTFVGAGLPQSVSNCMAERLVDRLSERQLDSLVRMTGVRDRDIRNMTVAEFLHRARVLVDADIYLAVSRVGLGCAIAG